MSRGGVEFQVVILIKAQAKENDVVVIVVGVFSREIFQAVQRPIVSHDTESCGWPSVPHGHLCCS